MASDPTAPRPPEGPPGTAVTPPEPAASEAPATAQATPTAEAPPTSAARSAAAAPSTGGKPGRGRRLLRAAGIAAALLLVFAGWEWLTWPDVAAVATAPPRSTAFIERARRHGPVQWTWVPYSRISPNLKRAVLVAEDLGFFDHHGFAVEEQKAALRQAWKEKRLPRGASTLTQQVAKNLWLTPSYNPWRKLKEALLTRQLEAELDKRRIFEIYLNVVEFGPGIYGAEAASRHYFGKPASALGEREAAELAAALPRPKSWHPGVDSRAYRWKTNLVLRRMAEAGWLWKVIG